MLAAEMVRRVGLGWRMRVLRMELMGVGCIDVADADVADASVIMARRACWVCLDYEA